MSTRTFTIDQLDEWEVAYVNLFREEIYSGRWTRSDRIVFRAPDDGKCYELDYSTGLTEYQDLDRFDRYPDSERVDGVWVIELDEVTAQTKVVEVTEWVRAA